jgi:ABC-type antimicrobial peptide transport system ATPase subunit
MSERAQHNYQSFKNEKIIKIGVIGNSNKGKSFILSKLSKIVLPSGTSIRTEGISVKYPDLDLFSNRRIVLLDSAGLETPVLKKDVNTEIKEEKEENNEDLQKEELETDNKNEKELFKAQ